MWTKNILDRYADTLEEQERMRLKAEIEAINFEEDGKTCVGIEGARAFARAGIEHLYGDLAMRILEFMRAEDNENRKTAESVYKR